ncbi:Protein CBG27854 [Caenorhabditis briggsae]|uniref:Protein CBG27854 n=1 Tax=Caenorhabditis briggsae TaxID=6238 RepID=B6IEE9_CAEBR|nr:Protein CBG27854 [Caenorhabditis briggsae]CAR98279.1 Protein CBG27854 [Caenorhabditis briggsae]
MEKHRGEEIWKTGGKRNMNAQMLVLIAIGPWATRFFLRLPWMADREKGGRSRVLWSTKKAEPYEELGWDVMGRKKKLMMM